MPYLRLASFLTVSMVTLAATVSVSDTARAEDTSFICGTSQGVPTTIAQTSRGKVPVIRWGSDFFSGSGWTPQKRCQDVSARFQNFYNTKALNYLTTGIMKGQNVVCTTSANGGGCEGLLFTLKPGSNPGVTLKKLLDVRERASGPLFESEGRVYVDLNLFLETAPLEGRSHSVERLPKVW